MAGIRANVRVRENLHEERSVLPPRHRRGGDLGGRRSSQVRVNHNGTPQRAVRGGVCRESRFHLCGGRLFRYGGAAPLARGGGGGRGGRRRHHRKHVHGDGGVDTSGPCRSGARGHQSGDIHHGAASRRGRRDAPDEGDPARTHREPPLRHGSDRRDRSTRRGDGRGGRGARPPVPIRRGGPSGPSPS